MRALKNKALLSVAASHFVVDYTGQLPNMMYPIVLVSMGLTYANVGLAAALYTLTNSLIQPFAGYLADRIGPRYVAATGVVLQATFVGLAAFARDFTSLVFLLALAGMFSGVFHPVGGAVANRAAGRLKGMAVGSFFIGGNLGFALSPVIAARVFERVGLVYAAFMIVPALLAAGALIVNTSAAGAANLAKDAVRLGSRRPGWNVRFVATLVTVIFFRSYLYSGLNVFIPLFYRFRGLPAEAGGLALSFFLGGFAFGTFLGGLLADRVGRKPVIVFSLVLVSPLVVLAVSVPGTPLALIAILGAGFLVGCSFTPTVVMVQESLPMFIGAATGIALGFTFAAGAAGQAVTGLLADTFGLGYALTLLALAPLFALPGGLLMRGPFWPTRSGGRPAAAAAGADRGQDQA